MRPIIRDHLDDGEVHIFVNPYLQLNVGLWLLFLGASVLLGLRIWVKLHWGHRLWWDDYILVVSWVRCHFFMNPLPMLAHVGVSYSRSCMLIFCCQGHSLDQQ
jgi:predicted membrane metal-binding protein